MAKFLTTSGTSYHPENLIVPIVEFVSKTGHRAYHVGRPFQCELDPELTSVHHGFTYLLVRQTELR